MSTTTTPHRMLNQQTVVRAASLAPSPDNNQPWRFRWKDNCLFIWLDPNRSLPSDVNHMFDFTGIGAAVENACLAGREMGFEPTISYFPHDDSLSAPGVAQPPRSSDSPIPADREKESSLDIAQPIARIAFAPDGQPDVLSQYLSDRCTNRKLYSKRPIAQDHLKAISEELTALPDVQLDWITERHQLRALARLVAAADRLRFQYQPFHAELYRQLRFSPEEAEEKCDGLDIRTLELPIGAARVLKSLRPWQRMKLLVRLGLDRLLTLPSARSVVRSAAIGVITVRQPSGEAFLEGGRALERTWLAATARQLAVHPLGSAPIFLAQLDQLHGQHLSPEHQRTAHWIKERFFEIDPAARGRVLLILFRLGRASPPRHRSLRRTVSATQ